MSRAQIRSPLDGSVYAEAPYAADADIAQTLSTAREAFHHWSQTSIETRAQLCRALVDYIAQQSSALAEELCWQMGRPIQYAPFEIENGFIERAHHMIDLAPAALSDYEPASSKANDPIRRKIIFQPHGVALVIAAWNYPYLTAVNTLIPALMAGNTVLLKHAQQTFRVGVRLEEAARAVGFPKGVFSHLLLTHAQVEKIIGSGAVDFVNFTGSVSGGHAIQNAAAHRFLPIGLELGGKDPAYVCADAPLEKTAEQLVDGSFFNAGQSCCGIERIYVDQSVFEPFLAHFIAISKKLVLGDARDPQTSFGPVISPQAATTIRAQIDQARSMGATAHLTEADFAAAPYETYLHPQILTEVTHEMDVMRAETFGPVVGIMAVQNSEEALRLMNDSPYGLTASIWTEDLDHAARFGRSVKTGTFFMNRCDYLDPSLAWGGVGDSGRGIALSTFGYHHVTRPQSFHLRAQF